MRTNRRGFTLIEVLVALIILSVVALGMGRFIGSFLHVVGTTNARTVATAVAVEQTELIRADNRYTSLVANYNNVSTTGFPDFPAMTRATRVTRTTGTSPRRDYTTITVRVTEPTMGAPVNVTIVVAAP